MNSPTQLFETFALLLGLWAIWNYGWQRFALDNYRQSLFGVRDALFDLARSGHTELDFNSRAYTLLRTSLNRRIRFAHRINFHHLWMTGVAAALSPKFCAAINQFKPPADEAIAAITDPELKRNLLRLQNDAAGAMLVYLVLSSPLFLALVGAGFICALLTLGVKSGLRAAFHLALGEVKRKEVESTVRKFDFQTEFDPEELEAAAA